MSSYERLIGEAIMAGTPEARQYAEDAVTVKLYASRNLWDQATTVVVEAEGYAPTAMHAYQWDILSSDERIMRSLTEQNARILDGRVMFAKKSAKSNV